MLKRKRQLMTGLMVGLITLMTTPAFSGSINLKDAGVPFWIFIIIGAVIILFQFVPTAILFFSILGTTSLIIFKLKKILGEVPAKEKVLLPGYEPTTLKKNRSRSRKWEF